MVSLESRARAGSHGASGLPRLGARWGAETGGEARGMGAWRLGAGHGGVAALAGSITALVGASGNLLAGGRVHLRGREEPAAPSSAC